MSRFLFINKINTGLSISFTNKEMKYFRNNLAKAQHVTFFLKNTFDSNTHR